MKKKILATVLTAAMAVSMLAGCSSESASKASEAAATTAEATTAAEETKAEETTAAEAKDTGDLKTVSIQMVPQFRITHRYTLRRRTDILRKRD